MSHFVSGNRVFTALIGFFILFCLTGRQTEASVTLAWDPPTTNEDGTPCTDLAGYKIYYDADGSGAPYNGTGLTKGNSPVSLPLSSLADPANPELVLSGLIPDTYYYLVVTAYDTSGNESGYSNEAAVLEAAPGGNDPPTAGITATPTQGMAPLTVSFSGTGTDTDGTVAGYAWIFGDGTTSTGQNPSHTYTSSGTYTATLTVTDDGGASGTDTQSITVSNLPNTPPTANAGSDLSITAAMLSSGSVRVDLDGSSSSDSDGDPLTYAWTQTQGSSVTLLGSTAAAAFFSATSALSGQTLAFQLIVNDGTVASSPDTVLVFIEEVGNDPPTVNIGATPTEGMAPLTVSFSGTGTDTDGTVTDYTWTFGDGSSSNGQNPPHTYGTAGTYTASLTVTDDKGARATASLVMKVTDPPPGQDSDNDGISDLVEVEQGLNPQTLDSDGDLISDFIEWGPGASPLDSDGDQTIDALDLDSDNDGKPDAQEGTGDDDGDGALNYADLDDSDGPLGDQDQDGFNNSTETTYMMNPNLPDSDGDGIDDGTEFGALPWPLDSEGDGTIDALDPDSDNDTKPDVDEGAGDDDQDGAPNYIDIDDQDGPLGDQDQDGFTNLQETLWGINPNLSDSDLDGVPDAEELGDLQGPVDTDGDGVVDALDPDSDDDGIQDSEESMKDMDENGLPDRLDNTTASFIGTRGKMALQLTTAGCRLVETRYLPEAITTTKWKPSVPFIYGGLQFRVEDVPVGGTVTVQVLISRNFHKRTQYWKFDPEQGYFEIQTSLSGNSLSFTLTDGGLGDADQTANGVIEDPGFISEPEEAVTGTPVADSGGGGGGGCRIAPGASGIPDGLLIFVPVVLLLILKRMRKI